MSAAVLFAASMCMASASAAQVTVQNSQVTLTWGHAAGPVAGYQFFVLRNGAPSDEGVVPTNQVTISGQPGDVVQLAVRAYGFPNGPTQGFEWGPESELSDPIRFAGQPIAGDRYPILDCTSCQRFELRDLNGTPVLSVPHPTPGEWDLIGSGMLDPDSGHALLRERASGALMVGSLTGFGMMPMASVVAQGLSASAVSPPVDFDTDGIDEILVHDSGRGAVTIWGIEDGAFVELSRFTVESGWRWIGVGDVDGDGQRDAWFDARGNVVAIHLRDLEAVTSTFIRNPLSGSTPFDVADYDGDGRSDLLFRYLATGALHVGLTRGSSSEPTLSLRALATQSNDRNVVPRRSLGLDDVPGAEIVLQDVFTGAVDVAHPADPVAGRRQRMIEPGASWRLVEIQ